MPADDSVFTQLAFWMLVVFSLVLPLAIYGGLLLRRAVSRAAVLAFGLALVVIAGVDVYLLQVLAHAARLSPSLVDDTVFGSEISTALYLLPALFGGVGVNIVSHVLVRHLVGAERTFEREHPPGADRGHGAP